MKTNLNVCVGVSKCIFSSSALKLTDNMRFRLYAYVCVYLCCSFLFCITADEVLRCNLVKSCYLFVYANVWVCVFVILCMDN